MQVQVSQRVRLAARAMATAALAWAVLAGAAANFAR